MVQKVEVSLASPLWISTVYYKYMLNCTHTSLQIHNTVQYYITVRHCGSILIQYIYIYKRTANKNCVRVTGTSAPHVRGLLSEQAEVRVHRHRVRELLWGNVSLPVTAPKCRWRVDDKCHHNHERTHTHCSSFWLNATLPKTHESNKCGLIRHQNCTGTNI